MKTEPKANAVVSHKVTPDFSAITFIVVGAGLGGAAAEATLILDKVHPHNQREGMLRGLAERCLDGAAKARSRVTGKPAAPVDKFDGLRRIVDHLNSGSPSWNLRSADGVDTGLVIQGMIRAGYASEADEANEIARKLAEKRGIDRDAALALWASTGKVASAMADIEAERARERAGGAALDADELLAAAMGPASGGEEGV